MIKNYNWVLNESEKNRILNLHENATKRHYINEADETNSGPKTETYNLNANWGDGMWKITDEQITNMKEDLQKIAQFVIKNNTKKVGVKIVAGESRVTNFDRESRVDPKTNKTITTPQKVEPGIIATNRANALNEYLEGYLKRQLDLGNVEFEKPETVIGQTPYDPKDPAGSKTKYAREYAAERFVRAVITVKSEGDECLSNMKFIVEYDPKYCVKSDPNTGRPEIDPETKQPKQIEGGSRCHACSEALFSIFINGLPLKDKNGSNIANLNNNNISQAVKWEGFVSPDIVNQLKQTNAKELVFTYACANQNGCHSDAMNVTITVNGQIAFKNFVSGGVRLKPNDGQRLLLKTDLCGKVIEVGKRLGTQDLVAKKRPEGSVDFSSMKVGIEKHNIVYNAVDPNTKLIDPKKVFDPNFPGDAPLIRQWSIDPKTWDEYKRQHSITPEMEKQIIDFKKENKS